MNIIDGCIYRKGGQFDILFLFQVSSDNYLRGIEVPNVTRYIANRKWIVHRTHKYTHACSIEN